MPDLIKFKFLFSLILLLASCFDGDARAQLAPFPGVEITRAHEKAKTAKKNFERIQRLGELGSASQKSIRDARLAMNLAIIDLSNLVDPAEEQRNMLLRAKLVLQYRSQELDLIRKLFEGGSVSQVTYERTLAARDVAASRLKAMESVTDTQRKLQNIKAAQSKLGVAKKEYEIADHLFQSGSVSKAVWERAKSNLAVAESELAESKKSLGARAFEVKKQ